MRRYSRCAIYKLKDCYNWKGEKFYEAQVVELVRNSQNPTKDKWEISLVKCVIFTDLPIEVANFDLEKEKNPLSFENISNPEHSIIRVLDFSVENVQAWGKKEGSKYKNRLVTQDGKKVINQKFYIHECEFDYKGWKSEERKLTIAQNQIEHFKNANSELRKTIQLQNKQINYYKEQNEKLKDIINGYSNKSVDYRRERELDLDKIKFEDI